MSRHTSTLDQHPAPHRGRVGRAESAFGLVGGPGAWFIQLCAGYVLASEPCFPHEQRWTAPLQGYEWTGSALGVISLACLLIAVGAALVSHSIYRRTRHEHATGHEHLLEVGSGRTRFLALWGVIGGWAFAVTTAFTAVGFVILPRCGG